MKKINPFANKSGGEILAMILSVLTALVVAAYFVIHTLNFFDFAFPSEQTFYKYLGFGLTGGGFVAYLVKLKYGAKTTLSAIVCVIMIVVCGVGELVAFGFGLQVETYRKEGITFTPEDIVMMVRFIQVLGFLHGAALVAEYFGGDVVNAFGKHPSAAQDDEESVSTSQINIVPIGEVMPLLDPEKVRANGNHAQPSPTP